MRSPSCGSGGQSRQRPFQAGCLAGFELQRGLFITLEGGDGTGKSTQAALIGDWFTAKGREVVFTREPGGTDLGNELREIVLHSRGHIAPRAEALLYAADRAHHVATRIRPALDAGQRLRIARASEAEGPALRRHATFDALDCHFRRRGAKDWRDWPARYRKPDSAAVARFATEHAEEIEFHLSAQWLAREGLDAVQAQATAAGMAIGLIADLAVGVHPGGSDSWATPEAMLHGLTIGAPPDPLGPLGQNWSITGFSPAGLRDSGYQPWIAMLRSALRSAGGLRIDHAFGLARLWVIPEGCDSAQGAYLTYPFLDLVRLVTLEAHRANALIIAEDLGTAPSGFTQAVSERNMLGMRVLWFERAEDYGFIGAHDYPANCVAMTGTHDTPTVAGWWSGRDLDWAEKLGRLPEGVDRQKAEEIRDWDRGLLWSTIGSEGRPAADNPEPAVHAALAHIGKSPAVIAL